MRPFRFGVVYATPGVHSDWPGFARRVESLGFDTLLVADHYDNGESVVPLLAAAAVATRTVRLGSYVVDNDFRHPAMLAKEFGTLDVLSDGRMELGIGAGWLKSEYDRVGIPFDPGPVRVDRLVEALPIIRGLLAGDTVNAEGRFYRIARQPGVPAAVQSPMPLLLGGGGPRMIRLAARVADIIAFSPPARPGGGLESAGFSAPYFAGRVDILDGELGRIGRETDSLERSVLLFTVVPEPNVGDPDDWIAPEDLEESPYALIGSPRRMADTLLERRERWGLSYIACFHDSIDRMAPVVELLRGR